MNVRHLGDPVVTALRQLKSVQHDQRADIRWNTTALPSVRIGSSIWRAAVQILCFKALGSGLETHLKSIQAAEMQRLGENLPSRLSVAAAL